jgi:hypothetical protein
MRKQALTLGSILFISLYNSMLDIDGFELDSDIDCSRMLYFKANNNERIKGTRRSFIERIM